jgi:ribosome-binding factor A
MESKENYKTARLCRQVAEALSLSLSECGEDLLLDLSVREVEPAPGPGRLVVTVETSDPKATPVPILAALSRAQGRLRAEVARVIQRKRAPELVFRLAAPE